MTCIGDIQSSRKEDPRVELDSHANMVVVGSHSFVFESSGKTCNVRPFMPSLGTASNVPIVDAAVAFDCPYMHKTYILIFRNALFFQEMDHCLVPPFILREGGLIVNDTPKIHISKPSLSDHSIMKPESDLHIHLKLVGIFSYFTIRKPTMSELYACDKIFMTPDSSEWDPHSQDFSIREDSMLDFSGNLVPTTFHDKTQKTYLVDDSSYIISYCTIDEYNKNVDQVCETSFAGEPNFDTASIFNCEVTDFSHSLLQCCEISKIAASIGATHFSKSSRANLFDIQENNSVELSSAHATKSKGVTFKSLAKIWNISEELAEKAIDRNTQVAKHKQDNILSRFFSTNDRMLRYRRLKSTFFTDSMFANKYKSLRQNTCCQVFVSDRSYIAVYPMRSQEEFSTALHWFCKQVGVPSTLVADAHKAQTSYKIKRFCDQVGTTLRILERKTPWSNRAELYIGILKEAVRKDIRASNCPMCLWDYAIERRATIYNLTPRPLFQLNGLSPYEYTFGEMGDISNLCIFGWYEWAYFRDFGSFPENKEQLGRVLGPTPNEGNEMAQSVLTIKGTVVTRRTLRKLRWDEIHSQLEIEKRKVFDSIIRHKLGDSISLPDKSNKATLVPYADDETPQPPTLPNDDDPVTKDGLAAFERPMTDTLINAEVTLPHDDRMQCAKVISRVLDANGDFIGDYDNNPVLNTMMYNVKFSDGTVKEYTANTIMENMYSQVDHEGKSVALLDSIIDHRKSKQALTHDDAYITTKSGQKRLRKTTIGWDLLIAWRDGSESWIPLKDMKQSNPLEVAEYAFSRGIHTEPAFHWWVPYILRKRDVIISSIKSRLRKICHKYGVQIPKKIEEAYELDAANGNHLWRDAINREMENLKVAFDILPEGKEPPPGYTKTSGHIIFDVRMTMERKARWVKDGHKTPDPTWSTYAGVVSRESVRIALTYASLNNLQICAADIQNAYLQAPTS